MPSRQELLNGALSTGEYWVKRAFNLIQRGLPQGSYERRLQEAHDFWNQPDEGVWASSSHWRAGIGDGTWETFRAEHWDLYETFARALGRPSATSATIEWGCGGGANAVVFAPHTQRFVAADVSRDSVEEAVRQVRAVCDTPVEGLPIDLRQPEAAIVGLEGQFDLFLCLYVLELTVGPEDGERILGIARTLLKEGGMALVQVKYHTTQWRSRGIRHGYRRNHAHFTTFGIDEFWKLAERVGLTPQLIRLVPKAPLGHNYAYFALTRS